MAEYHGTCLPKTWWPCIFIHNRLSKIGLQKIVADVYRWRVTPFHNILMFSVYLYSFLLLNCVPPVINKLIKKPIKNLLNKGQMNRSKNVLSMFIYLLNLNSYKCRYNKYNKNVNIIFRCTTRFWINLHQVL